MLASSTLEIETEYITTLISTPSTKYERFIHKSLRGSENWTHGAPLNTQRLRTALGQTQLAQSYEGQTLAIVQH